jgi:hypothetical protein
MGFPFLYPKVASNTLTSRHNSTPREPDARNTRAFGHYCSRAFTAPEPASVATQSSASLMQDERVYIELNRRGVQ